MNAFQAGLPMPGVFEVNRKIPIERAIDLDADGNVVIITIEHVKATSGKFDFSYETVAA